MPARVSWAAAALVLLVAACGDDTTTTSTSTATTSSASTATTSSASTDTTFASTTTTLSTLTTATAPTSTTPTTGVLATDCDAPAQPIALGQTVDSEIQATNQPYPANATYYCLQVPAGVGRVTIELTGLLADLDLYVGFGTIDSVQGVDISQGDTYDWKSNDFGTVDERIVIDPPEPGLYYIEIASYTGEFSPFTLAISV